MSEDSDEHICRICHCEGSTDNPLRCPCMCAGSIRYVHQDCLLQWLEKTSQSKRQCELCGTYYTFTPVFSEGVSPDTPLSPFELVRGLRWKLGIAIFSTFRFCFVTIMWLVLLPLSTAGASQLFFSRSLKQIGIIATGFADPQQVVHHCVVGSVLTAGVTFVFLAVLCLRDWFVRHQLVVPIDDNENHPAVDERVPGAAAGIAPAAPAPAPAAVPFLEGVLDDANQNDAPLEELIGYRGSLKSAAINVAGLIGFNVGFLAVAQLIPFTIGRIELCLLDRLNETRPPPSVGAPHSDITYDVQTLLLGYFDVAVIALFWAATRHSALLAQVLRVCIVLLVEFSHVICVVLIEVQLFTTAVGVLVDVAMYGLFGEDVRVVLGERMVFCVENPVSCVLLHWLLGVFTLFNLAQFYNAVSSVLHPTFPWKVFKPSHHQGDGANGVFLFDGGGNHDDEQPMQEHDHPVPLLLGWHAIVQLMQAQLQPVPDQAEQPQQLQHVGGEPREQVAVWFFPLRSLLWKRLVLPVGTTTLRCAALFAVLVPFVILVISLPVRLVQRLVPGVIPLEIQTGDADTQIPLDLLLFHVFVPFAVEKFRMYDIVATFTHLVLNMFARPLKLYAAFARVTPPGVSPTGTIDIPPTIFPRAVPENRRNSWKWDRLQPHAAIVSDEGEGNAEIHPMPSLFCGGLESSLQRGAVLHHPSRRHLWLAEAIVTANIGDRLDVLALVVNEGRSPNGERVLQVVDQSGVGVTLYLPGSRNPVSDNGANIELDAIRTLERCVLEFVVMTCKSAEACQFATERLFVSALFAEFDAFFGNCTGFDVVDEALREGRALDDVLSEQRPSRDVLRFLRCVATHCKTAQHRQQLCEKLPVGCGAAPNIDDARSASHCVVRTFCYAATLARLATELRSSSFPCLEIRDVVVCEDPLRPGARALRIDCGESTSTSRPTSVTLEPMVLHMACPRHTPVCLEPVPAGDATLLWTWLEAKRDPINGVRIPILRIRPRHLLLRLGVFFIAICATLPAVGAILLLTPLLVGKWVFNTLHIPFSSGVYHYVLGIELILIISVGVYWAYEQLIATGQNWAHVAQMLCRWSVLGLQYIGLALILGVIVPTLCGVWMELAIFIPVRVPSNEKFELSLSQDWALGLLALKAWHKMLLSGVFNRGPAREDLSWTRRAEGLKARGGVLQADASWTFMNIGVPLLYEIALRLALPYAFARIGCSLLDATAVWSETTIRFSFPIVSVMLTFPVFAELFVKLEISLRDELFLEGERLEDHPDND